MPSPSLQLPTAPTPTTASIRRPSQPGAGTSGSDVSGDRTGKRGGKLKGRDEGDEDEQDEDDEGRERKKGRVVLSCGQCKRRKVKCDRKISCTTCIKRGQPELCAWDEGFINPEAQPFALASQYQEVVDRLAEIEVFLQTLPPELRAGAPRARKRMRRLSTPDFCEEEMPRRHSSPNVAGNEMVQVAVTLEDTAFHAEQGAEPGRDAKSLDHIVSSMAYAPHHPDHTQHLEPTAELTSILAPLIPFVSASSSVAHGLDLCSSAEELEMMRRNALDKVYATFPGQDTAHALVENYFENIAWFYHCLHEPAFRVEHERFWEMLAHGRRHEVDPAWLALFCMVMALGLATTPATAPLRDLPLPSRNGTCLALYAAALRLFQLSGYARRPQFRTVQLVVLFGQFNITSPSGDDMAGFVAYLADGVRVAQKLRLHLLGDDSSVMPPEDAAFPPGPNSVKRQTAVRVWGLVAFLDTVSANARLGAYLVHNEQCTTGPLANLNTSQLSNTEWQIDPAPRSTWTDASLEFSKFLGGRWMKLLFDKLVTHASEFSYDTVLFLDRELRSVVSALPDALATESVRLDQANPKLRRQRFSALGGVHSRLVRLHRPYVLLGYSDSRYRYSTDSCLKAARICVIAHENGREELANMRIIDILYTATDIFDTQVASPMLRNVLTHGAGILRLLIQHGDQRWTARRNGAKPEELKSFPQVLRAIAKQLQLAQSPTSSHAPFGSGPPPLQPTSAQMAGNGAQAYTPSVAPSHVGWSSAMQAPQGTLYPQEPQHYPQHAPFPRPFSPAHPPAQQQQQQQRQEQPSGLPHAAPPYAPQLLADMGLQTSSAAPGAFDASWHAAAYPHLAGGAYGAHHAQGGAPYGMAPGAGVGVQPAWLMDGRDGASALLDQIGGA